MISLVIPCHYRNASLLCSATDMDEGPQFIGALPSALYKAKDFPPTEVVVVTEGGNQDDWEDLWAMRQQSKVPITVTRDDFISDYQSAAARGIALADGPFVIVMAPWVVIEDANWIGKFQNVILKSPNACIVSAIMSRSNTAPPHPVTKHDAELGLALFATIKRATDTFLGSGPGCLDEFQRKATKAGHRRWEHPGIKHFHVQHQKHKKLVSRI